MPKIEQVVEAQSLALESKVKGLEKRVRDKGQQIESLMEEIRRAEERLATALSLRDYDKLPPLQVRAPAGRHESTAFMIGSDWHSEETVNPATVNNRNEYNLTIADQRQERFWMNGLRMVQIHRNSTDINTVVVGLLGDHMTGYIHEELVEGNSLSPAETVLWLLPRIERGLRLIAKNVKRLVVVCAFGNHGRTTIKRRIATAYKNSYEWMMYHLLARSLAGTNIEFRISNGYHNLIEVYGRIIRFHHGDAIRYGGGVGGLYIPVHKAIDKWNSDTKAYLDVFGHWHQFRDGGSFISNGSLIGHSPFAVEIKAGFEIPTQAFFLIHQRLGKTVVAPIFVDK
jgi:hypothetical protein